MQFIKRLLGLVVALGVLVLGAGMLLPTTWSAEGSKRINGEPGTVRRLINDLETWPGWVDLESETGAGFKLDIKSLRELEAGVEAQAA